MEVEDAVVVVTLSRAVSIGSRIQWFLINLPSHDAAKQLHCLYVFHDDVSHCLYVSHDDVSHCLYVSHDCIVFMCPNSVMQLLANNARAGDEIVILKILLHSLEYQEAYLGPCQTSVMELFFEKN